MIQETADRAFVPFPTLIGDIGGTNARFALVPDATGEVVRFPNAQTADFPAIDDAIEATVLPHAKPRSAVLALAGPVQGDQVPLTNCPWVVEPKKMIARLGLDEVILLNDFEALSLSLPALGEEDLVRVGGGEPVANAAQVVVGPGTGLGAAALIHARGTWFPVPGEGGHVDLAPVTARDFAIWPHIEEPFGTGPYRRIAGETLLCGAGLVRLYRAIIAADGARARFDDPSEITAAALGGSDGAAEEALSLFCIHLGRLAGNLALAFMARGGVFLAGGIAAKIAPFIKESGFREAFIDKAPHQALMDKMPTSVIVHPAPALAGIAAYARTPELFGVVTEGRHWRR
ncbi:glucokinase [Kaistia dalseonensis]|uniref:Glucokinase n=1 Tax=Kaistia dalseonensis TaxID=410840 RepID=A0ABU0H5N7_9HYPH|nr:glucokinase [Kaistia dalseonensis]MCX5495051.1 glucokinase [Kaistia dalseonensis]MDQ0437633.1 glucokinase [Kaistia dalseonensis]